MKSVLLSIKPKYCMLIANGKKTVEVRKTRPKMNTPFKCYIYCTKERTIGDFILTKSEGIVELFGKNKCIGINKGFKSAEDIDLKGKVIGEFVCDNIQVFSVFDNDSVQYWNRYNLKQSCLTYDEVAKYVGTNKNGYVWYISDLAIYDKPKELSEFCGAKIPKTHNDLEGLKRPPQSWCYVEEAKS